MLDNFPHQTLRIKPTFPSRCDCKIVINISPSIFRAPFDVSLTVLVIMCIIIVFTWPENYGDTSVGNAQSLKNAFNAIRTGGFTQS